MEWREEIHRILRSGKKICYNEKNTKERKQMEVLQGRPADLTGRLEKEKDVYDLLDKLEIPFQRVDHAPTDTMEMCQEIDALLGQDICKNLFLCNRQKTKFYLLLIPGSKPFKTKDLSAQIGSSRLSFGGAEDMERLLNLTPGSVSVMGLMYDPEGQVSLLIDEDVLKEPFFGCHPCINTSSLKMTTADFREKLLPALGHPATMVRL